MDAVETNPVTGARETASRAAARLPELLAPAGDWNCAKAAVENGADAIYFGLERFNARMRAQNFTEASLPRLMEFLHRRGVKGYVTFNTLVFANELADAEQYVRAIIAAGVDAAIVQDVGICRLIRRLSPDFPIHASTQMTVTSAAGVDFARQLGCNLVVLARECSLKEIGKIQAAQELAEADSDRSRNGGRANVPLIRRREDARAGQAPALSPSDGARETEWAPSAALPLEVFVHGALCVAYSGQCLTSEALGGRSANRGECAQACRMPYELISDGQLVPLGDKRYLLSPQDLAGLEILPELAWLGVASLKIEGRLKTPEYVANITRVYRRALDAAAGDFEKVREESRYDLEMGFSRGLFTGWFGGNNNQALVHARFGKKRGVYLGQVARVQGGRIALKLEAPLKPGDGVVFDAGHPDQPEEGGRVYTLEARGAETWVGFGMGDLNFERIQPGDRLWKTSDPELDKRLRQSFAGDQPRYQRPVTMEIHGRAGVPMSLIARDEAGHVARVDSAMPLAVAEKQPLGTEKLREQLGRLGGTPFELGGLKNLLEGAVMLPVSELNRMRREAVGELEKLRAQPKRWKVNPVEPASLLPLTRPSATLSPSDGERDGVRGASALPPSLPLHGPRADSHGQTAIEPELIVLVRSLPQLEAALNCGVQTLYCELEDPKKYREAVAMVHCASGCASPGRTIWVAPPRIFKMGEEWILKQVRSCNADGYLVRNYDHLEFFKDARRLGDFSLNVANGLSAEYFKNRFGLERVTASYDLNFAQLEALLQSTPPEWFEITIHQHMPMFHMEHCVFCAFLSTGTDYTNCGRPCDKHAVKLRDRVGAEHPLKADIGCRNTVFNALAQTGAEYMGRMIALGARHFRIEFLTETPEQVAQTIAKYRQLLRGEIDGARLWRELKLLNQLGVTRGQMGAGGRE